MSLFSAMLPPKPFAPELERQFLQDYCERFILQRRIALAFGSFLVVAYYAYDFYDVLVRDQFDARARTTMIWRTVSLVFELLAAGLIYLPYAKSHERFASNSCILAAAFTFFRNLLCAYYADLQYFYQYYYEGMLLAMLVLSGLFRVLTKPTILLIIIFVIATAYLDFLSEQQARGYPTILTSFSVFSLVSYAVTLGFERAARANFLREQELQAARSQIARTADELWLLKEQAEQQNRDKSKFLADAAHDIRNVMQPVGNFLDASDFALTHGNPQEAHRYVKDTINANRGMRVTINALLDISGLESGQITIRASHFNLRRLVEEVLIDNQAFAEQLQVTLRFSKRRDFQVTVFSDRQHLKRILSNLVSNGIKYADHTKASSAHVTIAVCQQSDTLRMDVIDNGIGIALEEQANVFKPLYQLNNPERNREKGAGLGLSIVDSTLKLLPDHAYRFRSTPGAGTRFSLTLPKGDLLKVDEPAWLNAQESSLSELYVLLVENDLIVKNSMMALLHLNGAMYEAVSTLAELQALLPKLERQPDVLVSDYRLPDNFTAVDIIGSLAAHFEHAIPTLIITGEIADLSAVLPGLKVLRKPLEPKHLLAEIKQLGCDAAL